jgi:MFS family permease
MLSDQDAEVGDASAASACEAAAAREEGEGWRETPPAVGPPGAGGALLALRRELRHLKANREAWIPSLMVMLAAAWVSGCYTAWQTALPLMWVGGDDDPPLCDPAAPIFDRLKLREGDVLALAAGLTYSLGGPVAGALADRYFVRRLKRLLLITLLALLANFALICFSMPPPPIFLNHQKPEGVHFGPAGPSLAILAVTTSGLFAGASVVPAMELLAEAQYFSEGTSANLTMLLIQFFAVVNTALVNVFAAAAMHLVMIFSCLVCVLITMQFRESYARLNRACSGKAPGEASPVSPTSQIRWAPQLEEDRRVTPPPTGSILKGSGGAEGSTAIESSGSEGRSSAQPTSSGASSSTSSNASMSSLPLACDKQTKADDGEAGEAAGDESAGGAEGADDEAGGAGPMPGDEGLKAGAPSTAESAPSLAASPAASPAIDQAIDAAADPAHEPAA